MFRPQLCLAHAKHPPTVRLCTPGEWEGSIRPPTDGPAETATADNHVPWRLHYQVDPARLTVTARPTDLLRPAVSFHPPSTSTHTHGYIPHAHPVPRHPPPLTHHRPSFPNLTPLPQKSPPKISPPRSIATLLDARKP